MEDKKVSTRASSFKDEKRDLKSQQVVIKRGPLVYKTAEITWAADPSTGDQKNQTLKVRTYPKKSLGRGWDFDSPTFKWNCEGKDEIEKLKLLLEGLTGDTGTWRKIDPNSAAEAIIQLVEEGKISSENAQDIASALSKSKDAVDALASSGAGRIFTQAIQQVQREQTLQKLDEAVTDSSTSEPEIQKIVDSEWWLFGGRFIDKSQRRSLTVLDQLDIPLICYDGSLHIIELKRAYIPNVVVPYRGHYIVGPEVNEAVGQAQNYLRELEEQRDIIKNKLGIECRRISATVVIGHRTHALVGDDHLFETLRTYNSHLSRVEVVTFDELIANTRNALRVGNNIV